MQEADAVWTAVGGGTLSWDAAANWQNTVVPSNGDTVVFGASVGSTTATVALDNPVALSGIIFQPAASGAYVLSGSGADGLDLSQGGLGEEVSVLSGANAINAPIVLGDGLSVNAASGTSLTITGPISESGGDRGLTLSGGGNLTLSGSDSYTGGTTVGGGTLTVTSAAALPSSGLMTISSGGRLVLGGGSGVGTTLGISPPAASSDAAAVVAAATSSAAAPMAAATANAAATRGAVALQQAIASHDAVFSAAGGVCDRPAVCRGARADGARPRRRIWRSCQAVGVLVETIGGKATIVVAPEGNVRVGRFAGKPAQNHVFH